MTDNVWVQPSRGINRNRSIKRKVSHLGRISCRTVNKSQGYASPTAFPESEFLSLRFLWRIPHCRLSLETILFLNSLSVFRYLWSLSAWTIIFFGVREDLYHHLFQTIKTYFFLWNAECFGFHKLYKSIFCDLMRIDELVEYFVGLFFYKKFRKNLHLLLND